MSSKIKELPEDSIDDDDSFIEENEENEEVKKVTNVTKTKSITDEFFSFINKIDYSFIVLFVIVFISNMPDVDVYLQKLVSSFAESSSIIFTILKSLLVVITYIVVQQMH